MNVRSEVFERIDAHDHVELVIGKRELAYVRIHRCDRTLDTSLAENTVQLFDAHPEVARRDRHPTFTGEEDGGCAAAAAEIENPTSGSSANAGRMSSSCQSGCGPMSSATTQRGSYRDDSG